MSARVFALGVLAVMAVTLMSGCSGKFPDPATAVRAAGEKASEAKTVHFEIEASSEGAEELGFSFQLSGAVDLAGHRSSLKWEGDGLDIESRTLEGKTYTRWGDAGKWHVADAGDQAEIEEFFAVDPNEPFKILDSFGGKGLSFVRDGSEKVRGKNATKYSAVVGADAVSAADLNSFLGLSSNTTLEVWINDDGLPVRLQITAMIDSGEGPFGEAEPVALTIAMEFFDYGKPVEVEAPPGGPDHNRHRSRRLLRRRRKRRSLRWC